MAEENYNEIIITAMKELAARRVTRQKRRVVNLLEISFTPASVASWRIEKFNFGRREWEIGNERGERESLMLFDSLCAWLLVKIRF
jgi:hypothetical protein